MTTGEIQQESDGLRTATLNDNTFTPGDTITISGTVEERDINSRVSIAVIDPNGETVESNSATVTADNTFTFNFEAGERNQFDSTPMEESGNYRLTATYVAPGDAYDFLDDEYISELEFVFAYKHVEGQQQDGGDTSSSSTTTSNTIRRTINVTAINNIVTQGLGDVQQLNTKITQTDAPNTETCLETGKQFSEHSKTSKET